MTLVATSVAMDEGGGTVPGPQPVGLVVIVSACRVEQAQLLTTLPTDVTVLLAPSAEHAEEILRALPARTPVVIGMVSSTGSPLTGRSAPPSATSPGLGCRLLPEERAVAFGDRQVRLTPLEFAMLRVLASEPGRVFSFHELSVAVWCTGFVGDGAPVRAVVKRLRRKLADTGAPICIETVRSAGLRLTRRSILDA